MGRGRRAPADAVPENPKGNSMNQDQSLSQEVKDCMAACLKTAQACNYCGDDMVGMEAHGDNMKLMAKCTRLCRDCSEICMLAAHWMGRMATFSPPLCRLCAEVCDRCAEVCEAHAPHHALCGPTAKECRRCADMCRRMVGASKAAA